MDIYCRCELNPEIIAMFKNRLATFIVPPGASLRGLRSSLTIWLLRYAAGCLLGD